MSKLAAPLPDFERCDAFWARDDVDRPLLTTWVGTYQIAELYEDGLGRLPEGELTPADIEYELFRSDYERLYERHSRATADTPWPAYPVMVVPWVEAIVGCPIHHRAGNVWAEPWIDTYDRLDEVDLQLNLAWLDRLAGFTRWLVELSGGRFPVALSLMRGPADLQAAVRGAEQSIYDLFDYPHHLDRTLKALTEAWIKVMRAQLDTIPGFAGGHSFSCQHLWARKQGGWFQDDAIAFWSPAFYRKHVRACEETLSGCADVTGIHLHPASLFTVDELVKMPNLDVIEVNVDDVGPTVQEMIPRFQQILEKKRLLIWGAFTIDDLVTIKENLPTRGLALQLMGATPEQVQSLIGQVEEAWHA